MDQSIPQAEPLPQPGALQFQRLLLAGCIVLAPLSLTLYVLAWPENPAPVVFNSTQAAPIATSVMAGPGGNTLHFIGGVAASFFLPLGYLGMALLGLRRTPWLATFAAALSLVGWIPWSALIGIDALAADIAQAGPTPELAALWTRFNGDPVMLTYLLIYVIGHLLSAVLLGFMLGRLRLVPAWAAWAFALTSPLTMLYFTTHSIEIRYALRTLICALWISGALPAALAMLQHKDLAPAAPLSASGHRGPGPGPEAWRDDTIRRGN
jgi:hypothetical protein